MSQVIEVRFIDPKHGMFFDRMILPASKTPRDKEHREAIEMALDFFAGMRDAIKLKEMALTDEAFGWNSRSCPRHVLKT